MKRVLIAEDEQTIREFIVINLQRSGYETWEAGSGQEALDIYAQQEGRFDVAVLDIMMPGEKDGLAVCRELRQQNPALGIVMLTARTQEMDKVSGLMMGADDYMTKPFSPSELVARIDALYRRVTLSPSYNGNNNSDDVPPLTPVEPPRHISSGRFTLDIKNRSLETEGKSTLLTNIEFKILRLFFTHPGVALDRKEILKEAWDDPYVSDEKIVDVNMRRLRIKVEKDPSNPKHIITVWGLGYRWDE